MQNHEQKSVALTQTKKYVHTSSEHFASIVYHNSLALSLTNRNNYIICIFHSIRCCRTSWKRARRKATASFWRRPAATARLIRARISRNSLKSPTSAAHVSTYTYTHTHTPTDGDIYRLVLSAPANRTKMEIVSKSKLEHARVMGPNVTWWRNKFEASGIDMRPRIDRKFNFNLYHSSDVTACSFLR